MKWKRNLSWQRKRSDPLNLSPKVRTRCQCYKTFLQPKISQSVCLQQVFSAQSYICVYGQSLQHFFTTQNKLEQSSNLAIQQSSSNKFSQFSLIFVNKARAYASGVPYKNFLLLEMSQNVCLRQFFLVQSYICE